MYDRQRLIELFRQHALQFGEFQLASGRKSTYYLDGRLITLHAEGLRLIAEGVLETLADVDFAAVGGMSIGADPIVGGVLAVAAQRGRSLVGFLVRKEVKEHGTKRTVEGPVQPGSKVVIVDDVMTTGGSSLQAIDRAGDWLHGRLRGGSLRPFAGSGRGVRRARHPVSIAADNPRLRD